MSPPRALASCTMLVGVLSAATACGPWGPVPQGPELHHAARVSIEAGASATIRIPISLTVDIGSGDFIISDPKTTSVVRVDRTGRIVRTLRGRIPGVQHYLENWMVVGGPSGSIWIGDMWNGLFARVDLDTGETLSTRRVKGAFGVHAASAPRALVGVHHRGPDREEAYFGRIIDLNDEFSMVVPFPDALFDFPAMSVHSGLSVVDTGEEILVAYSALNELLVLEPPSPPRGFSLQSFGRRGVPTRRLRTGTLNTNAVVDRTSRLVAMDVLSDGNVILVHFDSRYGRGGLIDTVVWTSVVNVRDGEGCFDGRVARAQVQVPTVAISSDTLWLQQTRVSESRVERWIDGFTVDTMACDWVRLEPLGIEEVYEMH